MNDIFSQAEKGLDAVCICATAITGNQDSRHLGFFYRDTARDGSLYLLHLMGHGLLDAAASIHPRYLWGLPKIHEFRQSDLVAKAILVRDRNRSGRVPYGFSVPDGFFDRATGGMLLGPNNVGLTCATFVLALFHMIGIVLIDYQTWKDRPADKEFQDSVIAWLQQNGADPAYINKVKKQANGFRYRPEEVMAAALTSPNINTMDQLVPLGVAVVQKIVNS